MLSRIAVLGLVILPLAGCESTGSQASFCAAARAIQWSRSDTAETRRQVREHNAVGVALQCGWQRHVIK